MTAPIPAPLRGELLDAGASVRVIHALHPLRAERDVLQVPAGLSVAEIVELALARAPATRLPRAIRAWIGSDPVPAERWAGIRLKSGTTLVLRAVPGKGGGSLFKTLAMIAVVILTAVVVGPYLTPILGTFGTALVTTAITVGASLLINSLFPTKNKDGETGVSYSLAANQNLLAKYAPVPALHGQMRVYPGYGASPYTEFVGDDQYLRVLFIWGYAPVEVDQLKIGETPLSAYRDVEIQHALRPGDPAPTLFPTSVIQQDLNLELKQVDGWSIRTTSDDVTEWAVDIVAPQGLYATRKSGEEQAHTVEIEVEQSLAYAEAWEPVEVVSMTAVSTKPIRRTVRRPVPRGTYDIRVRRRTIDFDGNPKVTSSTGWSALRSYRVDKPIRFGKPVAVTALRIKATSQLSGLVDNFNGVCTALVRAHDGTAWVPDRPSSSPADHFVHVLQGPANPRPVADARIDWPRIEAWGAWCLPRGYRYDRLHRERQSVLETLQDIASAGRAALVFVDGKWSVVWDDPTAPVVQHFSARNSSGFRGRRSYRRLPHAWRIKFKNRQRGWRDDEITAYADGYDAASATVFEEVEFSGQTDRTLNWRHARYHDAQIRRRPDEYVLTVDIEHLVCTRGDRVRVSHPVPAWGIVSGRIAAVAGDVLELDEPVVMAAGGAYCIRLRLADGTSVVRDVVTAPGEAFAVTLSGSGLVPAAGDLWMFGVAGQETVVLRVRSIRPGRDLSAELVLVDDAPEIALADAGEPPPVDLSTGPTDPASRTPINLRVVEGRAGAADGNAPSVTFLWDTPAGGLPIDHFEVALKPPSAGDFGTPSTVPATQRSRTWLSLPAGLTGFRVRSFFTDGSSSGAAETTATIVGDTGIPPDVAGLAVEVVGSTAIISWEAPASYVDRLELRYSPATGGATWAGSTARASRAGGTTISLPFAAGTYFAAFVSAAGIASANPVALVVASGAVSGSATAGEVFDMAPFGDGHAGTVEADGGLRLAYDAGGALRSEGTYQPSETIDLGAVYLVRIAADHLAHGIDKSAGPGSSDIYGVDPFDWDAILETSATREDPAASSATWSPWSRTTDGLVEARGLRVRVRLLRYAEAISPVVELIHLRATLDARIEFGAGLVAPSGAGVGIAFNPPFRDPPAVVVTGRDFQAGERVSWSTRTAALAFCRIRDSAGSAVTRTFDWVAVGYGRRLS